jgi:hypothetical protein
MPASVEEVTEMSTLAIVLIVAGDCVDRGCGLRVLRPVRLRNRHGSAATSGAL